MQVTAKVASLYVKALLLLGGPSESVFGLASATFDGWLAAVGPAAAPRSRVAAAMRQQLQDSQLLQHLGPAMDAAAARLTAAAAALDAAAAATSRGSSGSSASPSAASQCNDPIDEFVCTARCCRVLLNTFQRLSRVLSAPGSLSIAAALPAAPAAVRLMLTVLQADSTLQLMQQQHAVQRPDDSSSNCSAVSAVHEVMLLLLVTIGTDVSSTLQACPAARELLLLPQLLSCLALMLVATVLGLVTSTVGMGRHATIPATGSSSSSSRNEGSSSNSGNSPSGSSGSSSSGSNCFNNGVWLDSLTPLSCSLFDILGVTKETVLQLARLAKAEKLTELREMDVWAAVFANVYKYQVS